jgi:hypothetical protein
VSLRTTEPHHSTVQHSPPALDDSIFAVCLKPCEVCTVNCQLSSIRSWADCSTPPSSFVSWIDKFSPAIYCFSLSTYSNRLQLLAARLSDSPFAPPSFSSDAALLDISSSSHLTIDSLADINHLDAVICSVDELESLAHSITISLKESGNTRHLWLPNHGSSLQSHLLLRQ